MGDLEILEVWRPKTSMTSQVRKQYLLGLAKQPATQNTIPTQSTLTKRFETVWAEASMTGNSKQAALAAGLCEQASSSSQHNLFWASVNGLVLISMSLKILNLITELCDLNQGN